jgi:hypothetical protein
MEGSCSTGQGLQWAVVPVEEEESFRSHYGPGVDSDSNRNEYQEHFVGGHYSPQWAVVPVEEEEEEEE